MQVCLFRLLLGMYSPRQKDCSQPFDNPEDGNMKMGASWHDLYAGDILEHLLGVFIRSAMLPNVKQDAS